MVTAKPSAWQRKRRELSAGDAGDGTTRVRGAGDRSDCRRWSCNWRNTGAQRRRRGGTVAPWPASQCRFGQASAVATGCRLPSPSIWTADVSVAFGDSSDHARGEKAGEREAPTREDVLGTGLNRLIGPGDMHGEVLAPTAVVGIDDLAFDTVAAVRIDIQLVAGPEIGGGCALVPLLFAEERGGRGIPVAALATAAPIALAVLSCTATSSSITSPLQRTATQCSRHGASCRSSCGGASGTRGGVAPGWRTPARWLRRHRLALG